jgi:hypothetical protein
MTTQASIANGSAAGTVTPGTPVHDIATVTGSGTSPLIDPTGNVKFFLCGPDQANPVDPDDPNVPDDPVGCPTGGTPVPLAGTPVQLVGGTAGDGIATANSTDVNTAAANLAPGTYCFRAEYSGDTNYDPDSETNLTTECFTVQQTSAITTDQSWLPQDSATVTTNGGLPVAGKVVFSLYENGTCSGTATTFEDTTVSTGGKFETNNTTYRTTSTIISWSAVFTPSNAVQGSTTTQCERSDLTINNSSGPFTPAP